MDAEIRQKERQLAADPSNQRVVRANKRLRLVMETEVGTIIDEQVNEFHFLKNDLEKQPPSLDKQSLTDRICP